LRFFRSQARGTSINRIRTASAGRMAAGAFAVWLDPLNQDTGSLQDLLCPFPAEALFARKVGTLVNNSRNEDPRCVQEADT
jgi:putative SOS response-associated peptidase YedK